MWIVLAEKLRAARRAKGLTLEQLEEASGVARRTIQRWEASDTRARPELVQFLATALGVEVTHLARPAALTARAPSRSKPAAPSTPTSILPERERLDEIARLEAREKPPKPRADGTPWLTARELHALYAAFGLREGQRFAFRGVVSRQGAASVEEAALVGAKVGALSCFVIERTVGELGIAITVLTKDAKATRALEGHIDRPPVTVILSVQVAPEHTLVFTSMLTRRKRAWAFVLESLEAK